MQIGSRGLLNKEENINNFRCQSSCEEAVTKCGKPSYYLEFTMRGNMQQQRISNDFFDE